MALIGGSFAKPHQDYNNKVLEGELARHRPHSSARQSLADGIDHHVWSLTQHPMHVPVAGNWFEDRFLEVEGTAVDPILRPYSGPEEPLVGATKGVAVCQTFLHVREHCRHHK